MGGHCWLLAVGRGPADVCRLLLKGYHISRRIQKFAFAGYKLIEGVRLTRSLFPPPPTFDVVPPLYRSGSTNYFNPLPYRRLVEPALEAAKPAHSRMFFACSLVFEPQSGRRLVPLSFGATKSSSSKTTKAFNGVLGSKNAVKLSRSKPPGATQIS